MFERADDTNTFRHLWDFVRSFAIAAFDVFVRDAVLFEFDTDEVKIVGETVLIVSGSSARMASGLKDCPVDAAIVGIIDAIEVNE